MPSFLVAKVIKEDAISYILIKRETSRNQKNQGFKWLSTFKEISNERLILEVLENTEPVNLSRQEALTFPAGNP